jgi:tRNA(Ile)-lysidine synthase
MDHELRRDTEGDPARLSTAVPRDGLRASLNEIFAELITAKSVLLAVSGGPDSVALMLMAADWAAQARSALNFAAPKLHVATVDHALRPESRDEAVQVARWAQALGLPHRTLVWTGAKPKTRIQERARDARYALLDAYAGEIGADYLLTAHHADDQAETILFRLLRGSGLSGLAGMPRAAQRGDLTHLRPLLGVSKADLVAYCAAHAQPFIRDPSNDNPAFARTHLRKLAPLLAREGLDQKALLRLGIRAARTTAALDAKVDQLRANLDATRQPDLFSSSIGRLADEPAEIFVRFIAGEIGRLAPGKPLRLDRLEALAAAAQAALQNSEIWHGSLAGFALSLDGRQILTILPEKPRRRGRAATENSPSQQ